MTTKHAVAFIEPEMLKYKEFAFRRLARIGRIVFRGDVILKVDMLESLFLNNFQSVPGNIWRALVEHLSERKSHVIVIQGDQSIVNSVLQKIGTHDDPAECDDSTLRYYLDMRLKNKPTSKLLGDGSMYHPRRIQCAKTVEEAQVWGKALLNGSFHLMKTT